MPLFIYGHSNLTLNLNIEDELYRNTFMINIEQRGQTVLISNFNEKGFVDIHEFKIPKSEMYDWAYFSDGRRSHERTCWNGRLVQKNSVKRLNRYRIIEWMDTLDAEDQSKIFDFKQPMKFFCDIEVEIQNEFPEAQTAATPVVSIALSDDHNNITVLATKELDQGAINSIERRLREFFKDYTPDLKFSYKYYPSEYDMLYTFFVKFLPKVPFLTGWYFLKFDWVYLLNRARKLDIPVERSSPTHKLTGEFETPMHKVVVDYMDIYGKWHKGIKENMTLDWNAQHLLGLSKVKYSRSLKELFEEDYELFVIYNAVDTHLVNLIDKKTSVADIFFKLGTLTKSEHHKAFSPVHMTENVLCRGLLAKNLVMVPSESKVSKDEKYKGAHVYKPKVGKFEYVAAFDFASLYPNAMRQFNISPESYLGKINQDIFEKDIPEGSIICANNAVFSPGTSVLRGALDNFYSKRKVAKDGASEIEREISKLKAYLNHEK